MLLISCKICFLEKIENVAENVAKMLSYMSKFHNIIVIYGRNNKTV